MVKCIVERLELAPIPSSCIPRGIQACHPQALVGMIFCGFAAGVFSSRKLEAATCESVAFLCIAGNQHSGHGAIAAFRRRFSKELEDLLLEIMAFAWEMGCRALEDLRLAGPGIPACAVRPTEPGWKGAGRQERRFRRGSPDSWRWPTSPISKSPADWTPIQACSSGRDASEASRKR